ncbi:hypothetical protein MWL04_04610 [Escherichia coli]|nr:hypothetical protein [Escherichia coli]
MLCGLTNDINLVESAGYEVQCVVMVKAISGDALPSVFSSKAMMAQHMIETGYGGGPPFAIMAVSP